MVLLVVGVQLHHASIMGDPFIQSHIDDLLRTIRTQVSTKGRGGSSCLSFVHGLAGAQQLT